MYIARVFGILLLVSAFLAVPAKADQNDLTAYLPTTAPASSVQRVVESVEIQGNRRLRDEDLMYYIKSGDVWATLGAEGAA